MSLIIEVIDGVEYVLDEVKDNKSACNVCALHEHYGCAIARSCNSAKGKAYYRLPTTKEREKLQVALDARRTVMEGGAK